MNSRQNASSIFVPGKNKVVVPFMRDVFTIPRNARHKPKLIGSVCRECEEYFFPKTGSKTTCDNPVCPRSTSEVLLSGKGKLLSATITRSSAEGDSEHVSAVILLDEGIKINSDLIGWEGYRDMLVPGSPVELVLQDLGENERRETQVGYAFRLMTGRRKPVFPLTEEEERAAGAARAEDGRGAKKRQAQTKKKTVAKKKAAPRKPASAKGKTAPSGKAAAKKTPAKKKTPAARAASAAKKKPAARKAAAAKATGARAAKRPARPASKPAVKKAAPRKPASKSARKRR